MAGTLAGLVESARAILASSERSLETVSNNVSNVSTPGFKRQISFSDVLSDVDAPDSNSRLRADFTQGAMSASGNPLDFAISGPGFFQLRSGSEIFYSRQGHFKVSSDRSVVTSQGYALQQAGGGERVALFVPREGASLVPATGTLFRADLSSMEEATSVRLRQGMVEGSNVSLGSEMVTMMTAVREAESGARLLQVYDDLIGRAITTFGQGVR
jgi:flagellar basal-body rod protein FlgG